MKQTFFGGKNGVDYICFGDKGCIEASGKKSDMLKLAKRLNYAVAKIEAVRFQQPEK